MGCRVHKQFLCGRTPRIVVTRSGRGSGRFRLIHRGWLRRRREFRGTFHRWLATLWEEKDQQIDALLAAAARATTTR